MKTAKRANRANPREDRNPHNIDDNIFEFPTRRQRTPRDHVREPAPQAAPRRKLQMLPRNLAQETYLDMLHDPSKHIVIGMGPAGTGKTMLAVQYAIAQLEAGVVQRIVLTKPVVPTDGSNLGALPGSLIDKLTPWFSSMLDVLKDHYGVKLVLKMLEDETILIAPLAMIRGRTFKHAVVVADEMQNATRHCCKAVLTRIGEGSKIIMTGDLRQHDAGFAENGLKDFIARLEQHGSTGMAICRFGNKDVERHPIIEDVLRLYGE